MPSVQTLIRNARLVPVAGVPVPTDEPLDLRVVDGIVTEVAERLAPELDDEVFDAAGRWAAPGLWDHHVHMSQWADVASRLDMSGMQPSSMLNYFLGILISYVGGFIITNIVIKTSDVANV